MPQGGLRPLPFLSPLRPQRRAGPPSAPGIVFNLLAPLRRHVLGSSPLTSHLTAGIQEASFLGLPFQGTIEQVAQNHSNLVSQFRVQDQGIGRALLPL